jgi:lipopolysaccharide transport system permease protein
MFFSDPLQTLWKNRRLLKQTTLADIRMRYAGSVLGFFWLFLYPLLFLSCYAVIYLCVYRMQYPGLDTVDSVLMIFCGLVPFLGFAEALSSGVGSLTSNANLIRNTLFPADLLPVKSVLMTQTTQAVGTVLLLIALSVTGKLTSWVFLLPVVWLLQLMFTLGLVWVLATLNIYLRDIQQMIAISMLLLMMISPISYTEDMVPASLRPILYLNPLYYIVVCYRSILLRGCAPSGAVFGVLALIALFSFFSGFWFFQKIKRVLADNV